MAQSFFDVIYARRSVRKFQSAPVPLDDLRQMADAARLAPSGLNRQRWKFILLDSAEQMQWFSQCPQAAWTAEAPAGALFCLEPSTEYWREDGSAAIENFMLAATALGYGSCWVQGQIVPFEDAIKERFRIPNDWRVLALVPVGIPDSPSAAPRKKTLDEVVSVGVF